MTESRPQLRHILQWTDVSWFKEGSVVTPVAHLLTPLRAFLANQIEQKICEDIDFLTGNFRHQ